MSRAFRNRFPTVNPDVRRVVRTAEKVLDTDVNLLILGESGTGKDFLARLIHDHGQRREGPCISIDCAALPVDLFESELFGHEKGAFTDAAATKPGKVELADGGTLVLEEVGALPVSLQAKLLRVVEEKRVSRLGGSRSTEVDVRIVSTSNMPIGRMLEDDDFRSDLFYRLNVVTIEIPALRDRREDIMLLARHFLADASSRHEKRLDEFDPEAERLLVEYPWPGNVRELRNVIEQAVILESGDRIRPDSLPTRGLVEVEDLVARGVEGSWSLERLEERYIREILRRVDFNYTRAAKILGIHRKTLLEKRKKYGIEKPR